MWETVRATPLDNQIWQFLQLKRPIERLFDLPVQRDLLGGRDVSLVSLVRLWHCKFNVLIRFRIHYVTYNGAVFLQYLSTPFLIDKTAIQRTFTSME